MSSSMARGGRRRRVLNEEARTASSIMIAAYPSSASDVAADPAPRYGEQANIENHPQITDYVPRRRRALTLLIGGGVTMAWGAQAADAFAESVATALPGITAEMIRSQFASGLVAWSSALLFLIGSALARVLYNLRRHRVDDFRGRYRIWNWACWLCLVLSVNSVVGLHELVAAAAAALAGGGLTLGAVAWRLLPLGIVAAWVGAIATRDASESRGALTSAWIAWLCYLGAALSAFATTSSPSAGWMQFVGGALPLMGHTFAVATLALYARYVVLDVQGLIEHPVADETATVGGIQRSSLPLTANYAAPKSLAPSASELERSVSEERASTIDDASDDREFESVAEAEAEAWDVQAQPGLRLRAHETQSETAWVDGSAPESDDQSQLSKVQRKRLRKQERRRAA